jgi:hypothetical protein
MTQTRSLSDLKLQILSCMSDLFLILIFLGLSRTSCVRKSVPRSHCHDLQCLFSVHGLISSAVFVDIFGIYRRKLIFDTTHETNSYVQPIFAVLSAISSAAVAHAVIKVSGLTGLVASIAVIHGSQTVQSDV